MSHADFMRDPRDSMRGAFVAALALHVSIIGAMALGAWLTRTIHIGDINAGGGSVAVTPVDSIPLPQHRGPENPLANESESTVPQTPVKAPDRVKAEATPKNAIPIPAKKAKQKEAKEASQRQIFRPYKELPSNQLTSKSAPAITSPIYNKPGSGNIQPGANTTLGGQFSGYGAQIQEIVARNWHTNDVDARRQTAPVVIATFELMRDGSIRNVELLQTSGILTLDNSVKRAILDSNPLPPLPTTFPKNSAKVEFTFELKR